jgi:hypothetical protein
MSSVQSINFPQRPRSGNGALMELPAPDLTCSKSILRALQSRRSTRAYDASTGVATVPRGLSDRVALGRTMALLSSQRIILAQSVGYRAGVV